NDANTMHCQTEAADAPVRRPAFHQFRLLTLGPCQVRSIDARKHYCTDIREGFRLTPDRNRANEAILHESFIIRGFTRLQKRSNEPNPAIMAVNLGMIRVVN